MMADQLDEARTAEPGDLARLLAGGDTWTVSA
jgi:2-oxoglutarate ferredoxin oxidoreductase subunit beta